MNAIGLCGAHRTGKTTLARIFAEHAGIPFVQTGTSEVFKQHGLDPAAPLDFHTRLWIQEKILEAAEQVWLNHSRFITDRTPIDFMAYTLADIQGATLVDHAELDHYLGRCFDALGAFFSRLAIVQPGIPLIHEPGKAALNAAYIEHLNTLTLGLCYDPRQSCPVALMPRNLLDLDARVEWLAHLRVPEDPVFC